VVVGLPRTLADREGAAAAAATAYARRLAMRLPSGVAVRLVDERMSTVAAARDLRASGIDTRRGRKIIDQAAAVIILQSTLDAERTAGAAPGQVLEVGSDSPKAERDGPKAQRDRPKAERDGPKAQGDRDVGAGGTGTDVRVDE